MINIVVSNVNGGFSIHIGKLIDLKKDGDYIGASGFTASLNFQAKEVEVIVVSEVNIDSTLKSIVGLCKDKSIEFKFSTITSPKIQYLAGNYTPYVPLSGGEMINLSERLQSYA